MLKRLMRWAEGVDDRLRGLDRRVRTIHEELLPKLEHQPTAKDLRELRQAVRALAPQHEKKTLDELERLVASRLPIVFGPWTGEVGPELLFWVPFVAWVREAWNIDPQRLLVVSRGGPASWYDVAPSAYADVFSVISPDEFRVAVAAEKRKQREVRSLDRQLLDRIVAARGLGEVAVVHPRFMFRLLTPFMTDEAGFALVDRFTRYRLLRPPDAVPDGLPSDYVAVRFYFSECFPDTADNRQFAQSVVTALAERHDVVLMNPGFRVDDHADWSPAVRGRIHSISAGLSPERNLAVQTAMLGRARALVGTYGGYSYVGPLHGVPTIAFYSRTTFKRYHLDAAYRAFDALGAAPMTMVDTNQSPLVRTSLPHAVAESLSL